MSTPPTVFIATPSHDHKFHASFALSLFRLQAARLCPLYLTKVGGAGVARARNNQAHEFLTRTTAEIFACIDADIEFEVSHFARALDHVAAGRSQNVNGLYALKQRELQWCINALPGETPDPATGLQRVTTAGTGFKFIHRSVFERMIAAHPEIAYAEDLPGERGLTRWDFFRMGVIGANSAESKLAEIENLLAEPAAFDAARLRDSLHAILRAQHAPGRYLTEDWSFDHRCAELGIPVHVDTTYHLKHEGLIAYPLQDVFASDEHSST